MTRSGLWWVIHSILTLRYFFHASSSFIHLRISALLRKAQAAAHGVTYDVFIALGSYDLLVISVEGSSSAGLKASVCRSHADERGPSGAHTTVGSESNAHRIPLMLRRIYSLPDMYART